MKNRGRAVVLTAIWLMAAALGMAQVQVVVPAAPKLSFGVSGFAGDASAASQVTDVLKNDLKLSGYFEIGSAAESKYVAQGNVRLERGQGFIDCTVTMRVENKVVLSKTYQGSEQDLRRMVHQLSNDIILAIIGERGVANTKIAFVWARTRGVKELAVMDFDGRNARQLTYDKSISVRPRWSPDGRKIIYTSYKSGFPDVLEVDLFTGQRKRLAAYPGLNSGAAYSPDGHSVALTLSKDGNPELYVMNASGGDLQRLTHTRGAESSPTWSPDGQNIAYVSDDSGAPHIWLISRNGGEAKRLTVSPAYNTEPDWSRPPAGSKLPPMLAVTSRAGGLFQIGVLNSATREVVPKIDGGDNRDPSWAPDGRHLVFTKTQGWRSQLFLFDYVTNEQVQLPSVEGDASEPAWGP